MPVGVLVAIAAVLGVLIGSFLNVVIYRVPRGESVIRPGSHCPSCGRQIRNRHNFPLLSWVALRGRCADCGAAISSRYPAVEVGTGLAFAGVTWWAVSRHQTFSAPAWCFLSAIGIALTLIDIDTHRLPNSIVGPSYPVLAALLVVGALADADPVSLLRAGVGMAALAAFYFLIVLVYPTGMGWGDVKLAGLLGMAMGYVSWAALIVGSFAGFALGAIVGVVLIAIGRATGKTAVPFGPFMIVGAFVGMFAGDAVGDWYLGLIGR